MRFEFKERGQRIKAWREFSGVSEKDVCDRFGWKLSHYRSFESGRIDMPTSNLHDVCGLFNLSPYEVMWRMPGEEYKKYVARELKPRQLPDQDLIRALFNYEPDTGVFTYKAADFSLFNSGRSFDAHHKKIGLRADKSGANGYMCLLVSGQTFGAHRMAVLYTDGSFDVSLEVDHINGQKGDNRRANIRLVTSAVNARNVPQKRNVSGFLGVYKMEGRRGGFRATCASDGVIYSMGPFATAQEASAKLELLKERMDLGFGPMHILQMTG